MSAEERAEAGAAGLTCKATARTCRRCDLAARRIASPAAPRPPRPARLGPTRTAAERKEDEARERTNRLEDIEWMVETGESWDGVLRRLGLSDSGAKAFLVRVDRADLIARLDRKRVTA